MGAVRAHASRVAHPFRPPKHTPFPARHQLFVDMVRAEAAQRQEERRRLEAEEAAAADGKQAPLRPPTRPADLPVYGQEFLSRG
jgi:hypothetical protein